MIVHSTTPPAHTTPPPTCTDCGNAIHDGDICIECWRDRRELAASRDREWWRAAS